MVKATVTLTRMQLVTATVTMAVTHRASRLRWLTEWDSLAAA